MDLKKLKFKHFVLNEDIKDPLNSIYYDDVDNEDNWIQLTSDSTEPDRTIVKIVIDCEDLWISVFTEKDIDTLQDVVEKKAEMFING